MIFDGYSIYGNIASIFDEVITEMKSTFEQSAVRVKQWHWIRISRHRNSSSYDLHNAVSQSFLARVTEKTLFSSTQEINSKQCFSLFHSKNNREIYMQENLSINQGEY